MKLYKSWRKLALEERARTLEWEQLATDWQDQAIKWKALTEAWRKLYELRTNEAQKGQDDVQGC